MGSEVAADSVYRGIQEGKSNSTALIDGIVEGAIEGFTEEHSVGDILDGMLNGGTIWQKLRNAAISEGSEEVASNWLNRAYDVISKQDKSEVLKAYNGYVDAGKSPAQALAAVVGDFVGEDTVSFLAGGLSGLAMSGAYAGANKVTERFVDPTASAWDQAMLDTMQGIQTPENVTQTRQATAMDDAISEAIMQGQSGITPDVATNKPKDVKNLLNATKEQITRYIQNAFNKQNQYKYLKISDVSPELAATLKTAGIDVDGYAHALRDNDLRHVDSSHGSKSNDKYKVTVEVLKQTQNIIDNYDTLYRGYDTKDGNPTVVYEKRMGNRTFYVEEVLEDGLLGTKQMLITGEDSKPSFLKKYRKIASVSDDTDVPTLSGTKGQSPPSNHVQDAPYNTSYNQNITSTAGNVNTQNQETRNSVQSDNAAGNVSDVLNNAREQYGTIPAGENPVREVSLPQSVDGKTKVSRFARTAAEAQVTTDEMVSRIEQMVADGSLNYEVYSNKQALNDGARYIRKQYERGKSIEQIRSEFIRDAERGFSGAERVATGTTLYADAVADGNYQAAADILLAIQHMKTNSGQTIQAARLMKSMTPEGRVFLIQGC